MGIGAKNSALLRNAKNQDLTPKNMTPKNKEV
jgi:hypothetical protein